MPFIETIYGVLKLRPLQKTPLAAGFSIGNVRQFERAVYAPKVRSRLTPSAK
jgi:hypothetical protein